MYENVHCERKENGKKKDKKKPVEMFYFHFSISYIPTIDIYA